MLDIDSDEDWTRRTASDDDPDYAWVYYGSELRTAPWRHDIRHERLLEDLLDEFDSGMAVHDVDPADTAYGFIWKEPYKVDHQQLSGSEVREQAEAALEKRYKKPWETSEAIEGDDEAQGPDLSGENAAIIQIFI